MGTEDHGHRGWSETAEAQREADTNDAATGEPSGPEGAVPDGPGGGDSASAMPAGEDAAATAALRRILEAALLVAGRPLSMNDFDKLFAGSTDAPPRNRIRAALAELGEEWRGGSLELQEVATGYRAQVRNEFEPWIARLWDEKPPRYSRALLETLAIIAYRQPMTRSEIEDIRGVSVSSQIIRTLTEREWIRVVGHRESPGRPAMYGTTREFLDYFNLKTLDQLPPISDVKDLEGQYPELGFEAEPASVAAASGGAGESSSAGAADTAADPAAATADSASGVTAVEAAGSVTDAVPRPDESGEAAGSKDSMAESSGGSATSREDRPPIPPDRAGEVSPSPAASGNDQAADDATGEGPCTPAS